MKLEIFKEIDKNEYSYAIEYDIAYSKMMKVPIFNLVVTGENIELNGWVTIDDDKEMHGPNLTIAVFDITDLVIHSGIINIMKKAWDNFEIEIEMFDV